MRGYLTITAALAAATPGCAQDKAPDAPMRPTGETQVENAANRFFEALRGEGNATLAEIMHPDGVIMISDRRDRDAPKLITLTNADYLARRDAGEPFTELMDYDIVVSRDGVAQVWGPYRVIVDGKTTHCGINSMSFVEVSEEFWQLGNTSFTMVPPDECGNLDAPPMPDPEMAE